MRLRCLDKLPLTFHHMRVIACSIWDIVDAHLRQAKVHAAGASKKQRDSQVSDDHG